LHLVNSAFSINSALSDHRSPTFRTKPVEVFCCVSFSLMLLFTYVSGFTDRAEWRKVASYLKSNTSGFSYVDLRARQSPVSGVGHSLCPLCCLAAGVVHRPGFPNSATAGHHHV